MNANNTSHNVPFDQQDDSFGYEIVPIEYAIGLSLVGNSFSTPKPTTGDRDDLGIFVTRQLKGKEIPFAFIPVPTKRGRYNPIFFIYRPGNA